jgi:hypothetical protein
MTNLSESVQQPLDRSVNILHQPLYDPTPCLEDGMIMNTRHPKPSLLSGQGVQPIIRLLESGEIDGRVIIRKSRPVIEIDDLVHYSGSDVPEIIVTPFFVPVIRFMNEDFEVEVRVLGVGEDEDGG